MKHDNPHKNAFEIVIAIGPDEEMEQKRKAKSVIADTEAAPPEPEPDPEGMPTFMLAPRAPKRRRPVGDDDPLIQMLSQ